MNHVASDLGPLAPGARVALVATAGVIPPDRLDSGVRQLGSWGLEPVTYPSVTATHQQTYLSGPDSVRAADLQQAWCDPAIDAVVVVRGGYGTTRTLDLLDADVMRAAEPKPVYGSSDVTALHEWLAEMLGVRSWFTPMIATSGIIGDDIATAGLHHAMFERWQGQRLTSADAETLVPGLAHGRLIGGNLSLLAATVGARSRERAPHRRHPDEPVIALLEDVGEDTYKYDGYLVTLLRSGWFDGVTGIALGSWAESNLAEVRALVDELLVPIGVPLVWELGFGHGAGAHSVPLGVPARLDADDSPALLLG